ncbi:MAG: hypothetical protein J6Z38_00985 [Lachnospiraceae bacterium]|nr:hypothetical protein [Lachnospiraceae bacterium]
MIIRKCSIDRFGTLSGRTYAFEDGLNVVRGLPEEEAETLQAFIRVMLYGLSEADRTAYTPEEGEGAFGGSLEVSSGDTLFSVQRNFDREAESFKVTRLSDGAAAVYPDLWVAEALGRLPEEKFVNGAWIRRADFDRERGVIFGSPEELKAREKEQAIRDEYAAVKAKMTAEMEELNGRIDWEAREVYDRSVTEIKALKERQLQIRKDCPELEKEVDALKRFDDLKPVMEAKEAEEQALQENVARAQTEMDAFTEKTQRKAQTGGRLGTFLMTLGMLLGIAVWFYAVSVLNQNVSGPRALYVNIGAVAAIALFAGGLISAIVSGVKVKKAAHIGEEDTPYKQALDEAQETFAARKAEADAALDSAKNDPERLQRIADDEAALQALKEEIRVGTARYSELYQEIDGLRGKIRAQLPLENEYRALEGASGALGRLIDEADEKKRSEVTLSLDALTEVALTARLSYLSDVDPQKKVPVVAGNILSTMSEKRRDSVLHDVLAHEGRQVILLTE